MENFIFPFSWDSSETFHFIIQSDWNFQPSFLLLSSPSDPEWGIQSCKTSTGSWLVNAHFSRLSFINQQTMVEDTENFITSTPTALIICPSTRFPLHTPSTKSQADFTLSHEKLTETIVAFILCPLSLNYISRISFPKSDWVRVGHKRNLCEICKAEAKKQAYLWFKTWTGKTLLAFT